MKGLLSKQQIILYVVFFAIAAGVILYGYYADKADQQKVLDINVGSEVCQCQTGEDPKYVCECDPCKCDVDTEKDKD